MPRNYPEPPYPPSLDGEQYDVLWQQVCKGKILLIGHLDAQEPLVQGLLRLGYLKAIPRCRTPEERTRMLARLERCLDELAALSREAWSTRFEDAHCLVDTAHDCRRQLVESDYHVSDAGYQLVRDWENTGRDQARALSPARVEEEIPRGT